jgi:hypothetical protein
MGRSCHDMKELSIFRNRGGKKACVLQRRDGCRKGLQNSRLRVGSPGTVRAWPQFALQLTIYMFNKGK